MPGPSLPCRSRRSGCILLLLEQGRGDAALDRSVAALVEKFHQRSPYRIEVDIGCAGEQAGFVGNCCRLFCADPAASRIACAIGGILDAAAAFFDSVESDAHIAAL